MANIQHADLPDQFLHEPKGARTAGVGSVYVADGNGSGSFTVLPVSSLDFDAGPLPEVVITPIPTTVDVDGTGLLETDNGVMADVTYVMQVPVQTIQEINKNFKELYVAYERLVSIHSALKTDVEALTNKVNALINTLETIGFIDNE